VLFRSAGSANGRILVTPIKDDLTNENNETVHVRLLSSDDFNMRGDGDSTLIINEPIGNVNIAASNSSITEGNDITMTISIARAKPDPVEIEYEIGDGSEATEDDDFTIDEKDDSNNRKVTIPKDATSVTFTLETTNDSLFEGDETLVIKLKRKSLYALGNDSDVTISILDLAPVLSLNTTEESLAVSEGSSVEIPVLTPSGFSETILYEIDDSSTATTGDDFSVSNVANGLLLSAREDSESEETETVVLRLVNADTNPTYGIQEPFEITINIQNIDPSEPVIGVIRQDSELDDRTVALGGSLTGTLTIAIPSELSADNVSGTLTLIDGSAAPSWATLSEDSVNDGEAIYSLVVAPPIEGTIGHYHLLTTFSADLDQDGTDDTSLVQEYMIYVTASGGNS